MSAWPKWIGKDERLNAYLHKQVDELSKMKFDASFEQDDRLNRVLDDLEQSLAMARKSIGQLFDIGSLALIGTFQNDEIKEAREVLLENARELFEDADYSVSVGVGVDYEKFQWAILGAEYKLREFRLHHPRPKKGRRKSDSGKSYLAWAAIHIGETLAKAGFDKTKCEKAIDAVFDAAGHKVPSDRTIARVKKTGGVWGPQSTRHK